MLIKYIHSSEPTKEKIFDTVKAFNNMEWARNDSFTKLYKKTQSDFDEIYKEKFAEDQQKGVILSYEIIS